MRHAWVGWQTATGRMAEAPRMRATRKTYLECPYAEKDACKAEGGRFDGERRKWYVPVGAELGNTPFLFVGRSGPPWI